MLSAFNSIVDYAGLFPPAALSMDDAVAHYDQQLKSTDRWMLGRFVVPASRLEEFSHSVVRLEAASDPWQLSVVVAEPLEASVESITRFESSADSGLATVNAIEARVADESAVTKVAGIFGKGRELYLELPHQADYSQLMIAIGGAGARAKLRTGGITADAFPSAAVVARFIAGAVAAGVPFKATAGLHHPWRGLHRLSYDQNAPRGVMFGFVAVLTATAALIEGESVSTAEKILLEDSPDAFQLDADGLTWGEQRFSASQLETARQVGFQGFGSCSFREPVDELALEVEA